MLAFGNRNRAANLSERYFRMDCRIKSGNDDVRKFVLAARFSRPSFAY
jgi:hypothetical protein